MANNKDYKYTLPIGTKLKGTKTYHFEEVLGQGGYGITYKVWAVTKEGQILNKVSFAIKEHFVNGRCHRAADGITVEYSQEAAGDVEESLRDFTKEGRLLNRICQTDDEAVRFIVPVNEVIKANNTAYYVMQYLDGGSLRDMVLDNHGGIPEAKALALFKPIVRAVDYIHQHKILHMDIKPSNIVMHKNPLTDQEEPVLIDFGVSLHFTKKGVLTSKHSSYGRTEGFSPIEQYGAVETFAPWMDVYALGATLYYLLTGKMPPKAFDMTPDDVDKNLPSAVSERTKAAIKHAMAKDYHDRTQSASTFLWELENDYEPVMIKDPNEKKDVEDINMTVKKKPVQTEGKNPQPPIPPTPNRKLIRLIAVGTVLVAILGAYLKFGPKSSQNVINPDDSMHELWIADSIEKARKDSIAMEEKNPYSIAYADTVNSLYAQAEYYVEKEKIKNGKSDSIFFEYTGALDRLTKKPKGYGYAAYFDGVRDYYEGEFVDGLRNDTNGKLIYKNGDVYKGSFINDHFGEGKYTIKEDSSYFIGFFHKDKPYNGCWYNSKGKQISKVTNGNEG